MGINVGTALILLLLAYPLPFLSAALSGCGGPCNDLNNCRGQLICINGKCNDDPDVGTHICPPPSSASTCRPSGTLYCRGTANPTYTCSPRVTASTAATLTNNDFEEGGNGGGPSECDNRYHRNPESIVALSTGWYAGGSRCGNWIRITARNGLSTTAKVVDECDSRMGCDKEHAYQPPCRNNIVDASKAVWDALGLNVDVGEVPVTWSMA